jgi:hypothetical protein
MSFTGIDSDYNLNAGSWEETGKKTGKKVARRATPDYIRNDKIIMRRTTLQVWIHGSETLRNVQERSSETPFSNVQQCSETVHKRICCRGSECSFIMVDW